MYRYKYRNRNFQNISMNCPQLKERAMATVVKWIVQKNCIKYTHIHTHRYIKPVQHTVYSKLVKSKKCATQQQQKQPFFGNKFSYKLYGKYKYFKLQCMKTKTITIYALHNLQNHPMANKIWKLCSFFFEESEYTW